MQRFNLKISSAYRVGPRFYQNQLKPVKTPKWIPAITRLPPAQAGARRAEIKRMASAFEHDDLTKALAQ
ncbi:hypothetical protein [Sphingobium tyrosinilyticum]|uniref:hypothetical protein n=1 Tax=Sphingobium tyrosinilyticum TaxID=2715436 RepID=UPI0036D3F5AB